MRRFYGTPWVQVVDIKRHLGPDKSHTEVAKAIDASFRLVYPKGKSPELDDILDLMLDAETVEAFDFELDCLYDWADENRVWLGLGT